MSNPLKDTLAVSILIQDVYLWPSFSMLKIYIQVVLSGPCKDIHKDIQWNIIYINKEPLNCMYSEESTGYIAVHMHDCTHTQYGALILNEVHIFKSFCEYRHNTPT